MESFNRWDRRRRLWEDASKFVLFLGDRLRLNLLAWGAMKKVQLCYNEAKCSILRTWDKALFRFDKHRPVARCRT
jgi:hypothetical protein